LYSYRAGGILNVMSTMSTDTLVIRSAVSADLDDLRRLAALDSARALLGEVLVAEADGIIHAAYSVDQDRAIADPFLPTADLVALLETRAALLRDRPLAQRRRGSALTRALLARP
jgi:hypothetical protein